MCKNIQDAISIGKKCADKRGVDEVMVIGGQYIFESVMSETQKIYLTEVNSSPKGDVFFPNFNLDNFIEISKNEFTQDEGDSCMHRLVVYEKKAF